MSLFWYDVTMYIMGLSKGLSAVQCSIDEGVLPHKKLGFVPTAGETYASPYFVEESRIRLRALNLNLEEIDITHATREELIQKLEDVDGIYVAGGNAFFLLQQLQMKNLVQYLRERVQKGLPYFGESAGAVLLSGSIEPAKPIDDPLDAPSLKGYAGLDLIDFFILPHVDREKYRDVFEEFLRGNSDKLNIVQIRDGQAVITRDGDSYEVIASSIIKIK
jgi:dipeptidase E